MATFTHTIRPMLDSVRMHPLLVTASKDAEISATRYIRLLHMRNNISYGTQCVCTLVFFFFFNRWKKMEHHDIVIECGRFTLDKCREEILSVVNFRYTPPLGQHYHLHI